MKPLAVTFILSATIVTQHQLGPKAQPMHQAAATTYEHLATAIIEIRKTEDNLVKGILMHHHIQAGEHLATAAKASGGDRAMHLEAAAEEIANIANEGGKQVQAVRQRLLKAGHHHNTDAETNEDYIFVNSKEKRGLLALSGRVGKMGTGGSSDDVRASADELDKLFLAAIAPE